MKQRQQSVNLNNEDDSTRQEAQTRKPATRTAFDSSKPWQGQRKAETFKAHKVLEQKRDAQTGRHDRHVSLLRIGVTFGLVQPLNRVSIERLSTAPNSQRTT